MFFNYQEQRVSGFCACVWNKNIKQTNNKQLIFLVNKGMNGDHKGCVEVSFWYHVVLP